MKYFAARAAVAGLASAILVDVSVANCKPVIQPTAYRDQVTALREDIRETRVADKLNVNTKTKFRLVFPNKCEKEGEFELYQLASSNSVEESFVLIPDLCLWIEVGYDEKRNRVSLDSKFINALNKQFYSLIFYHIHAGEFPHLENYFPAYKDLITLALVNGDYVWDARYNIHHRLISKLGVIEYKFASNERVKKLIDRYKMVGLKGYESQNLAYEYMRKEYIKDYYSKVQRCKSLIGTMQQKISRCCPLETKAFILHFRPMYALVHK